MIFSVSYNFSKILFFDFSLQQSKAPKNRIMRKAKLLNTKVDKRKRKGALHNSAPFLFPAPVHVFSIFINSPALFRHHVGLWNFMKNNNNSRLESSLLLLKIKDFLSCILIMRQRLS